MFDLPSDRNEASPDVLGHWVQGWSPVVGRDLRPLGVRLTLRCHGGVDTTMAAVLDAVLAGFEAEGGVSLPHGLVVLAPRGLGFDESILAWRAPRNVVLELPLAVLADETSLRHLFEVHRRGIRLALRVTAHEVVPEAARLAVFQYLLLDAEQVVPIKARTYLGDALVLAIDGDNPAEAQSAIGAGAHGIVGWALVAQESARRRPLAPTQKSVLDLIRLVQSDAELEQIEEAFKAEPVLAYMLLTLANSPAFVRTTPIGSLRHAIMLLGYRRLVKWLVLLMVVASKDNTALPQIYCAVARGFLMENLAAATGAKVIAQDEAFVVGVFSLLSAVTGQTLPALLEQIALPEAVRSALLTGDGPNGKLLALTVALECTGPAADDDAVMCTARELNLDLAAVNAALLQALSATDALVSVV